MDDFRERIKKEVNDLKGKMKDLINKIKEKVIEIREYLRSINEKIISIKFLLKQVHTSLNAVCTCFISFCIKAPFLSFNIGVLFSIVCVVNYFFIVLVLLGPDFSYYYVGYAWMTIGPLSLNWGFHFDYITIIMLFVVTTVSFLVHVYSLEYMSQDVNQIKFMNYLTLFTFSMFILVTSNNFVQMFIGWEGVGICSFLLINFWDTRNEANTSALKAIIFNRIGDFGLMYAFILMFGQFGGTFEYSVIFVLLECIDSVFFINLTLIGLFIFIGAVGKSAQIFLHVWLPDAMEGPTPVSALIHAATMVTAGVFLLVRCGVILTPICLKVILIVGAITALFAGSIGMVQMDLKKIIAYSTCSQLGFMCVACGLGAFDVALFHLAMHAFFKALLFLSAGSIIHSFFYDEQDIRRLGGSFIILPITYVCFLIGSLALIGFPFLAGYYSKDVILEILLVQNCPITFFSIFLCFLAVICTTFYSTRLLYLVFFSSSKQTYYVCKNSHESSYYVLIPLIILSVLSIVSGYLFRDYMISLSVINGNLVQSLHLNYISLSVPIITNLSYYLIEEMPIWLKLISFFIVIFIAIFTFLFYHYIISIFQFKLNLNLIFFENIYKSLHLFLVKKWYFDIFYSYITLKVLEVFYTDLLMLWDRGFVEFFGPYGSVLLLKRFSVKIASIQNGNLEDYLRWYFLSISCVFSIFFVILFFVLII